MYENGDQNENFCYDQLKSDTSNGSQGQKYTH